MPDLRQALKDFVATSNSGIYQDEATLLSKFPELKGYNINALKDFVATSNSGVYTDEEQLFSKFPEFGVIAEPPSKKKVGTVSTSEDGFLGSPKKAEEQGWLLNTVSSLDKGFYKNFIGSPVKGLGTLLEGATAKVTGGSGKGFISDALIKFGDYFNKTIDELTPQDEAYKNSLSDQFGQAFGQVASLIATGGATGAVGKGASLASQAANAAKVASVTGKGAAAATAAKTLATQISAPTSISAGLSMGQAEFDRAKEAGATDDQAFEAFYKNATVGSVLETIPVMQFFKRFEKASAGGIKNYLKTKGVAGLTGGVEEMTTEIMQQIYANKSAQDIYNTNQELFEGVGSSGGVGFGVGFLLNAMGANAKLLRKEGKNDEADMVEGQIKEFEGQVQKGGPSSYKLNGIKIEPVRKPDGTMEEPSILISNLIDKMDATDLAKANIDIVNDPELKIKLQDKIVSSSIKEQVKQGNPDLNEPSLNAITELELQLRKLEGNTTQTGKDKAAVIRGQIKNIQENQLAEEVDNTGRIAELEGVLSSADKNLTETGFTSLSQDARVEIEKELQDLKTKQNAVQKQTADESLLRTGESQLGLQQVVEGDQGPQVTTTGTQETITPQGTQEIKTQIQQNGEQTTIPTAGPIAGNRLFNKPLTKAKEVANGYYQRIFGTERPSFAGTRILDEARAKRIADAYESMKDDPNNLEVRAAYDAMSKETLDQYKDFVDAGFTIEVDNEEPYNNSQEMIDDLKNNNRIKIFSTEAGYGDTPITDEQRQKNPLLQDSGIKDVKGNTLLVNDIFRAIHDFYGHAELGNSFGPKGEENAWNIHARMFSPLARRAMTTETRGQNSYVNFSGVNEKIDKLREEARRLREQGDEQGAKAIVDRIYQEGLFAEQKIGLLPEEFSQFDEADSGDVTMRPEGLQERDIADAPKVGEFEAKAKKLAEDIENFELPSWFSASLPEGTQKSGLSAADFKKLAAKSVIEVGKLMDRGVEFAAAVREAVQELVNALGEANRGKIEQTVKDYFNKGEGVSENELPGYDALSNKVDAMIATQTNKKVDPAKIEKNVIKLVQQSDAYKQATDVQKEQLVREARKKLGLKEKSAPSVKRLKTEAETEIEGQSLFQKYFGAVKKDAKVTMTEKNLLKKQIKDLARGAKDAKVAWMKVSNELSKGIKELTTRGTISDTQAKNVLRKFSKVNMFSQKSVDSFIDYMTNVFANAEYSSKLSQANSLKKDISKLSKDKNKNANLRDMAQQFVKIDPSMVEDVDAYNDMAAKIKEAIKGSTIRVNDVAFADIVNIEDASKYINKTLEAQDEKIRQQKAEEIQELMGIDASEFSYDDMMDLLDKKKSITKYNESIIRDTIQKMFNIYSSIINETINTGVDQFNGEEVEFTDGQKELVKSFMNMDLAMLSPKESLQAVDALANFLQNKSTAKMQSVVSNYEGITGAKEIANSGLKASPLKKYNIEWLGQLLGNQFTNLNILFERMFKGVRAGAKVMYKMGFTALVNGKAFAQKQSNNIVDKYVEQFYKREANGEAYNTEFNNTERGLAAFMMRNVIGTEKETQEEFNRRKDLILKVDSEGNRTGSIAELEKGNEQEQKKAKIYQKVYDKILKDAESIQEVKDNTDKTNLEGIEFWMNEWANKYEQLADVSENVYNKVLEKDLNYTPDRFAKLSTDTGVVELGNDESAFHANNGTIYDKETGVLMTAQKPKSLPTNPENGDTNRFIELSFDNNNANSMYDALVDINTAAPIKQIQGFLNSTYFKKIVPESSNATILKDRIDLYVRNIRNKNPYSTDELDTAIKKLNKIAAIGVGQALGGPTQVLKQVIPAAMNTIINSGGLDVLATFNEDKNNFIENSGYGIANRGGESQSQIKSLNRLAEEAAKSTGEKLFKGIEKANEFWLKKFLVNADVYVAKASWLTYYEQELAKLGYDTKNLDYKTHELNKEAANYAQIMVDRQQNVSDADLAGKMFASKDAKTQAFVKGLMPFASFRMNQSARLGSDLATLMNKTSTEEDKKIAAKSLSGYAVEAAMFRVIGIGIATLLGTAVKKAMGVEETEEEKKKRMDNLIKGARTGTLTDLVSPLPLADKFIQMGASSFLNKIEKETKLPVSIYGASKQDLFQSAGLFGIAFERLSQTVDIAKLAATGKYTDDFGKEKTISEQKRKALGMFVAPALLSNLGLAPTEVNSAVRYAIKDAKSNSKTSQEIFEGQEKAEEKQLEVEQKTEALDKLKQRTRSQEELDVIEQKIDDLDATSEEKKLIEAENKEEKQLKEELLTDPETGEKYDNETELKRYNPRLYNKNFGPRSEWFKEHKVEKEVQKKLNKEIRKMEDIEQKYIAPVKNKLRKNSDGTTKRTYSRVRRDANGKVISSYSRTSN